MAQVSVTVPHQLEKAVAVQKLQAYSQQAREQFAGQVSNVQEKWNDDGVAEFEFRLMGFQVTGTTTTRDDAVQVVVQIPFAAIPIRGMIERELANRIRTALSQ